MKSNFAVLLGTTALLSVMMMAPLAGTAMARDYDDDATTEEIQNELDDLREEMEDLREELREAQEERREELQEAREDRHEGRGDRHHSRISINGEEREMTAEEREEFEEEMREFEQEMEEFGREMAELDIEMSNMNFDFDFSGFELDMSRFGAEMAAFGAEMAGLEDRIMADLAAKGLRIESDANGNETVWLSGNHSDGDADMRVVSTSGGDDLVYFYFNGFDEDYSFVMEDGPRNTTIVHAYDTDAVSIESSNRRNHNNVETDLDRRGNPTLVIRTNDEDDYEVVRLNRRRFN